MALQIRRGTNAVRAATLLLIGEPFYVTDHVAANVGPFWLGDGVTFGGKPVTPGTNEVLNGLSDVYVVSPLNNQHLVYDTATNRFVNRSNITVPGTLTSGNIDIIGPITTRDNYFTLNSDNTTLTGTDNGFTLKRGTGKADVWIRYNVGLNRWEFTNDGAVYNPFPDQTQSTTSDVIFKSLTTTESIRSGSASFTLNNQNTALTDFNNGIFLKRGTGNPDAVIKYNASTTRWQISDDGVNYFDLAVKPQTDLRVNRLGIGTAPTNHQLQLFNSAISNMSLTTNAGSAILTNNAADNLLSLSYYGANRLQFNGSTGNQWFGTGRTGFNTTNPTETVDVNGTIKGTNLLIAAGVTSASVFTSAIATNTVSASGNATVGGTATVSGDLTVNTGNLVIGSGNINSPAAQGNLFNAGVNNINIGNGASIVRLGSGSDTSDVIIKPRNLVGERTTQHVFNTVATTVNAFGAANTVNIGSLSGNTNVRNNLTAPNLAVNSTITSNSVSTSGLVAAGATMGGLTVNGNLRVDGNTNLTNAGISGGFRLGRTDSTSIPGQMGEFNLTAPVTALYSGVGTYNLYPYNLPNGSIYTLYHAGATNGSAGTAITIQPFQGTQNILNFADRMYFLSSTYNEEAFPIIPPPAITLAKKGDSITFQIAYRNGTTAAAGTEAIILNRHIG